MADPSLVLGAGAHLLKMEAVVLASSWPFQSITREEKYSRMAL